MCKNLACSSQDVKLISTDQREELLTVTSMPIGVVSVLPMTIDQGQHGCDSYGVLVQHSYKGLGYFAQNQLESKFVPKSFSLSPESSIPINDCSIRAFCYKVTVQRFELSTDCCIREYCIYSQGNNLHDLILYMQHYTLVYYPF